MSKTLITLLYKNQYFLLVFIVGIKHYINKLILGQIHTLNYVLMIFLKIPIDYEPSNIYIHTHTLTNKHKLILG